MRIKTCVWCAVVGLLGGVLNGKADTITSPQGLAEWYDVQVADLPPAPVLGGEVMELNASPRYVCTALRRFPKSFVQSLIAHEEYDLYLYDLWIIPDFSTGELVFYNENFGEVGAVAWYDSEIDWPFGVYAVGCTLVDERDWDDLQAALEAEAEEEEVPLMQPVMMSALMDSGTPPDPATYIRAGISRPGSNITVSMIVSNGFTNAVEIYSTDDLLTDDWSIRATNLQFSGGYTNTWTDPTSTNAMKRFYIIGNGGLDLDGDGLIDSREAFIYLTDRTKFDTDGDGIGDGEELLIDGTDPLDFYSVRPPDILRASGASIVDESGNPVLVKSVNIGSWLAWEQWMMQFGPSIYSSFGTVLQGGMDEQMGRQILINRFDDGLMLHAVDADASNSVTRQTADWVHSSLCPNTVQYIGNFATGSWLRFTRDFGPNGVSNLAIGVAVDASSAGRKVEVRLNSPSGTKIGELTVSATGPYTSNWRYWTAFNEQRITLSTALSGTQTVYFVGNSTSGDIGNLVSFRFYGNSTPVTDFLVETFREACFSTNDLDRLKSLGYNAIRVPFFHWLLEDDDHPGVYKQSGWALLDWVLDECAKRRMWALLDLHGAPGGINPWHSCGYSEPFRNRFWQYPVYQQRTSNLWAAIATRYSTHPAVLGYDLLNEPYPPMESLTLTNLNSAFSNNILPAMNMLYHAVRAHDTNHLVFMAGNQMHNGMWEDGSTGWWPTPASRGWTNVCYEFHSYEHTVWGDPYDPSLETQKASCDSMLRDLSTRRNGWNAPVFIGEFGPCGEQNFEYWTRRLNAQNISWCHWNYRSWGWDDGNNPDRGKTTWGLDYRTQATTNDAPNFQTDDLSELYRKMGMYSYTNYTDNECLQTVMQRNLENPDLSRETTCEYYFNTFDAGEQDSLSDDWVWNKVSAVGNSNAAFRVYGRNLRLRLDWGTALVRSRTRVEADARYLINDAQGSTASIEISAFAINSTGTGKEAGVSLAFVRDEIDQPLADYPTEGIIARLAYDHNGATATLELYAKTNAVSGTLGTNLYASSAPVAAFAAGAALELHVDATSAYIRYNGTDYTPVAHGLDLDDWPDNAVCLVQAEELGAGNTVYIELDNWSVQRQSITADTNFVETFDEYVEGIELGATPERASYPPDTWSTNINAHSYVSQEGLRWVPNSWNWGSTWYNPRRTYQDDTRFTLTTTNVLEMQMACGSYSNGIIKLGFVPEYIPGDLWGYNGAALYAEIQYTNATHMRVDLCRQYANAGGCVTNARANGVVYSPGEKFTLQISGSAASLYYGTNCLINQVSHQTNAVQAFVRGAYPHFEYQNEGDTDNAVMSLDNVVIRQRSGFGTP